MFKWCCMARGRKFEEKRIRFALYAEVVRQGGLRVPIMMRYSAIPGHCGSLPLSLSSEGAAAVDG